MAKATKKGLTKIGEQVTINLYDNGYMVEANGRDDEGDWATVKTICAGDEELFRVVKEYLAMERDD